MNNRTIYRLACIISAILIVGTIIGYMLLPNEPIASRITSALVNLCSFLLVGYILRLAYRHPELNHNYTLRRRNGHLRWERIHYGPDTALRRLCFYGLLLLVITLLLFITVISQYFPTRKTLFNGVIVAVVVAAIFIAIKGEQNQQ